MRRKIILSIIIAFVAGFQLAMASVPDSLRLEYIDGKAYVVHQIDPGETLYSISKRYNASMNAIADANPEVKKGLHDGMILRVPYKPKVKTSVSKRLHIVGQGETLYSISRLYDISVIEIMEWNDLLSSDLEIGQELIIRGKSTPVDVDFMRNGMKIHVVQAGEGLYALARNYEVSVDELVEWNNLESSALNLGQEIIVAKGAMDEEPVTVEDSTVVEDEPMAMPLATIKNIENGMAAIIEGGTDDQTYLAMHRTIPVGSLVAVRNEMNNQMVFVRIIGKLPETGINDKIIIRLSASAVKQIHAIDPKFRVEITYFLPE